MAFARTLRTQGVGNTFTKVRRYLQHKSDPAFPVDQLALTNQEQYLIDRSAQNTYLRNYIAGGISDVHLDLIRNHFIDAAIKWEKTVIFPLSYPLELTQRPDHILRNFSENGYQCLIICIDNEPPSFREISPQIYLTNLFAPVITYFSVKKVIFYLTYPFYSYIVDYLKDGIIVYDVLDDLSVFSLNCDAMRRNHKALLTRSDITLFSSNALLQANKADAKGEIYLVTNGVWPQDFKIEAEEKKRLIAIRKHVDEFLIGYHGAITELLDWELLEKIVNIPRVRLVLIGPIINFHDTCCVESQIKAQQRVLGSSSVTHIQTIPYAELKYYLADFDAGIVPFEVNEKTDPVSPLKLFEYMAMGLKVFATPTETLLGYSDFITIADRATLPSKISEWVHHSSTRIKINYDDILRQLNWANQLAPILARSDDLLSKKKSHRSRPKSIDIVNVNFFDWDGITLYRGGAERYVFDLACLLKENGWSPRVLQNANYPFEKDFNGIPVLGVQTGFGYDLRGISRKYREACKEADLIIASPLDLACELYGLNVIGINHGIYWDHRHKSLANVNIKEYDHTFDALKVVSSSVCVDTNFINWVRTYDYSLSEKLKYVPNYFDCETFYPIEKNFDGRIHVLYPRRLYEARGIFITLKAFDYLFQKHSDIDLHLVGQANAEDGKIISRFVEKYGDRVKWEEFDMHEMYKVYQASHITLVPTMYSEGTSLSCLEAMATNNAVIATNIGGLPNLVIDGFNGCLIDPKPEALIQAIELLLGNRKKMREMASNAMNVVDAFEKKRWIKRWLGILAEVGA